jgi:catechol 2,3-dioxygenase-like lactoylglutathione lyase family enzyme
VSITQMSSDSATEIPEGGGVDMNLEVVVVPVSDVDQAKRFSESLGWLDADFVVDQDFRVVQLTPTGSECSIIVGNGVTSAVPGSVEERADYGSFASFSDPDGNGWLLQEVKTRAPGR